MAEPVVEVINFAHHQYVTFWCPLCETRHTFKARKEGTILPFNVNHAEAIFCWNGDPVQPSLSDYCVRNTQSGRVCHIWIADGKIKGRLDNGYFNLKSLEIQPLLPVSQWPIRKPPEK